MKWGNAIVKKMNPYEVELTIADKDFKGTKKFSWISNLDQNITVEINEFDNILSCADATD